jgi:hypothetical protein
MATSSKPTPPSSSPNTKPPNSTSAKNNPHIPQCPTYFPLKVGGDFLYRYSPPYSLFLIPYSLKTPTHSVYYPTATCKQPASKQTVKERTQKYTTRVCVFAKRRRLFTTEGSKQSKTIPTHSVYSPM